jgi:hypothetical protein
MGVFVEKKYRSGELEEVVATRIIKSGKLFWDWVVVLGIFGIAKILTVGLRRIMPDAVKKPISSSIAKSAKLHTYVINPMSKFLLRPGYNGLSFVSYGVLRWILLPFSRLVGMVVAALLKFSFTLSVFVSSFVWRIGAKVADKVIPGATDTVSTQSHSHGEPSEGSLSAESLSEQSLSKPFPDGKTQSKSGSQNQSDNRGISEPESDFLRMTEQRTDSQSSTHNDSDLQSHSEPDGGSSGNVTPVLSAPGGPGAGGGRGGIPGGISTDEFQLGQEHEAGELSGELSGRSSSGHTISEEGGDDHPSRFQIQKDDVFHDSGKAPDGEKHDERNANNYNANNDIHIGPAQSDPSSDHLSGGGSAVPDSAAQGLAKPEYKAWEAADGGNTNRGRLVQVQLEESHIVSDSSFPQNAKRDAKRAGQAAGDFGEGVRVDGNAINANIDINVRDVDRNLKSVEPPTTRSITTSGKQAQDLTIGQTAHRPYSSGNESQSQRPGPTQLQVNASRYDENSGYRASGLSVPLSGSRVVSATDTLNGPGPRASDEVLRGTRPPNTNRFDFGREKADSQRGSDSANQQVGDNRNKELREEGEQPQEWEQRQEQQQQLEQRRQQQPQRQPEPQEHTSQETSIWEQVLDVFFLEPTGRSSGAFSPPRAQVDAVLDDFRRDSAMAELEMERDSERGDSERGDSERGDSERGDSERDIHHSERGSDGSRGGGGHYRSERGSEGYGSEGQGSERQFSGGLSDLASIDSRVDRRADTGSARELQEGGSPGSSRSEFDRSPSRSRTDWGSRSGSPYDRSPGSVGSRGSAMNDSMSPASRLARSPGDSPITEVTVSQGSAAVGARGPSPGHGRDDEPESLQSPAVIAAEAMGSHSDAGIMMQKESKDKLSKDKLSKDKLSKDNLSKDTQESQTPRLQRSSSRLLPPVIEEIIPRSPQMQVRGNSQY